MAIEGCGLLKMDTLQTYYTTAKSKRQSTNGGLPKLKRTKPIFKRAVKRTVKYLSICKDPTTYRHVVRNSSDPVIKTICNAALNVERGDIHLSKAEKKLFRANRLKIAKLTSRKVGLPAKRRILEQRGSGFFIPALISAAVSALAGSLFGGKKD